MASVPDLLDKIGVDKNDRAGDILIMKQYMQATSANLQAIKADLQAVTASAQIFKMDYSVFKYDERGLTFMGKPIGPQGPSTKDLIAVARREVMAEVKQELNKSKDELTKDMAYVRRGLLGDIADAKSQLKMRFEIAGSELARKVGFDIKFAIQAESSELRGVIGLARTAARADSSAAHQRADAAFQKAVSAGQTADAEAKKAQAEVKALRGEAGRAGDEIQKLHAAIKRIDEAMK
jgi:hypothetical protein